MYNLHEIVGSEPIASKDIKQVTLASQNEASFDDWDLVGSLPCSGREWTIYEFSFCRTPPGAIFTVVFDDEKRTLELVKRTEIPKEQPISWMTFDVRYFFFCPITAQSSV
jgi:hypothetical protein